MSYNNIICKIDNRINTISINRPNKLNALNIETFSEIDHAVNDAINNPDVRLIVITGIGIKAFAAGADIKEFIDFSEEEAFDLSSKVNNILTQTIENSPLPIIAAINGYALGGGLEIAMACHLRIASDNAKMGLPEVSLGLIPGYGGSQRLPQLVGKGKAFDMIMTGKMIDADEALISGLINYKTSQEELLTFTKQISEKILLNSSNSIKHVITCINANYKDSLNGYEVETKEFSKCFQSKEFIEGTQAFIKKRKPNFN